VPTSAAIRPVLLSSEELLKRKPLSRVNKQSNGTGSTLISFSLYFKDCTARTDSLKARRVIRSMYVSWMHL